MYNDDVKIPIKSGYEHNIGAHTDIVRPNRDGDHQTHPSAVRSERELTARARPQVRRPERHLVVRQRLRPLARAPSQQHQRHGLGAPGARRRLSPSQMPRAQQVPRVRGRRPSGRRRPVLQTRDPTDRQTCLSYSN